MRHAHPETQLAGTHGFTEQQPNSIRLVSDFVQLVERDGIEGVACSSLAARGTPSARGQLRN